MEKLIIDVKELAKLREEKGMSDRQIVEFLRKLGINKSEFTIATLLTEYYKAQENEHVEKQENTYIIDVRQLAKLKEREMSDREIAEYLRERGINRSTFTINKLLREYYQFLGKEKPKKSTAIVVDIEELVRLKEEAKMTDKEIAEHFERQGFKISVSVVADRLRKYYKSLGKEKPKKEHPLKNTKKIDIDIQELVELKEEADMSDREIAEYLRERGINRCTFTINKLLREYYQLLGKEKPKIRKYYKSLDKEKPKKEHPLKNNKKIDIDIQELVQLKEEADMSDREIVDYLSKKEINISEGFESRILREYYQSQSKEKPKARRDLTIDIEVLVKLKEEQEMSDKEIVDYLNENAIVISESVMSKRFIQYYNAPEGKKPKIEIGVILDKTQLAKIKESQNMSNKELAEYFQEIGFLTNATTIGKKLIEYYKVQGKEVFRKISDNPNKKAIPINELSSNRYDDDIEEMLMRGMSIKEFILNNGKYKKEDEIRQNLKKLRVVAEYAKKERNIIIPDLNFTTVLDALEEPEEKTGAYVKKLMNYMNDGVFEEGKLNEVRNMVFLGNIDLMIYIFERLNINLYPGQDVTLFQNLKNAYRNKIRRYLRTVEQTDANRRKKQVSDDVMEIGDM